MSIQSFQSISNILLFLTLATTISCTQTSKPTVTDPQDASLAAKKDSFHLKDLTDSVNLANELSARFKERKENPYDEFFYTTLKGGYRLDFRFDTARQYLILKKGYETIDTIAVSSILMPYKSLGFIGDDFGKTFVFVQSYGSGNPDIIQLYDKKTARNLIKENSAYINADAKKHVLLFLDGDEPDRDSLSLYDEHQNSIKKYAYPKGFGRPNDLRRIELVNISAKTFTIRYDTDKHTFRR